MAEPVNPGDAWLRTGPYDTFGSELGRRFPHSGIDYSSHGGRNVPLYAIDDAFVARVGAGGAPGNTIVLWMPDYPVAFLYGHCHRVDVRAGQYVQEGQQIGLMGKTGNATGVHLHLSAFTTQQGAINNAVPSPRNGRTVAAWAAANGYRDPLEVIRNINRAKQPKDVFNEIMSFYTNRTAFEHRLRDIIRNHVPKSEMKSGLNGSNSNVATEIRRAYRVGAQNRIKNDRAEVKIDRLQAEISELRKVVQTVGARAGVAVNGLQIDEEKINAVVKASEKRLQEEAKQDEEEIDRELSKIVDEDHDED